MATVNIPGRPDLDLRGKKVEGLGLPSADTDSANKQYVDNLVAGIDPTGSPIPDYDGADTYENGNLATQDNIVYQYINATPMVGNAIAGGLTNAAYWRIVVNGNANDLPSLELGQIYTHDGTRPIADIVDIVGIVDADSSSGTIGDEEVQNLILNTSNDRERADGRWPTTEAWQKINLLEKVEALPDVADSTLGDSVYLTTGSDPGAYTFDGTAWEATGGGGDGLVPAGTATFQVPVWDGTANVWRPYQLLVQGVNAAGAEEPQNFIEDETQSNTTLRPTTQAWQRQFLSDKINAIGTYVETFVTFGVSGSGVRLLFNTNADFVAFLTELGYPTVGNQTDSRPQFTFTLDGTVYTVGEGAWTYDPTTQAVEWANSLFTGTGGVTALADVPASPGVIGDFSFTGREVITTIVGGTNVTLDVTSGRVTINSETGSDVRVNNGGSIASPRFTAHAPVSPNPGHLYSPPFQQDTNDVSVQIDTRVIADDIGIPSIKSQIRQIQDELTQVQEYNWLEETIYQTVFLTNRSDEYGSTTQENQILNPRYHDVGNELIMYAALSTSEQSSWDDAAATDVVIGFGPDVDSLIPFQLTTSGPSGHGSTKISLTMVDPDAAYTGTDPITDATHETQFESWASPASDGFTNPIVQSGETTYYYNIDNANLDTVRHSFGSGISGSALTAAEREVVDDLVGVGSNLTLAKNGDGDIVGIPTTTAQSTPLTGTNAALTGISVGGVTYKAGLTAPELYTTTTPVAYYEDTAGDPTISFATNAELQAFIIEAGFPLSDGSTASTETYTGGFIFTVNNVQYTVTSDGTTPGRFTWSYNTDTTTGNLLLVFIEANSTPDGPALGTPATGTLSTIIGDFPVDTLESGANISFEVEDGTLRITGEATTTNTDVTITETATTVGVQSGSGTADSIGTATNSLAGIVTAENYMQWHGVWPRVGSSAADTDYTVPFNVANGSVWSHDNNVWVYEGDSTLVVDSATDLFNSRPQTSATDWVRLHNINWSRHLTYFTGDIVLYSGITYAAAADISGHTTNANPSLDTTNWNVYYDPSAATGGSLTDADFVDGGYVNAWITGDEGTAMTFNKTDGTPISYTFNLYTGIAGRPDTEGWKEIQGARWNGTNLLTSGEQSVWTNAVITNNQDLTQSELDTLLGASTTTTFQV